MTHKTTTLPPKTSSLLENYLTLPFNKTKIACPYWVNDLEKGIRGPYSGKGTPKQLVAASYRRARKLGINLDKLSKSRLKKFLEENMIGIDCSGFVFHLMNMFDKENGGDGITKKYLGYVRLPGWRASWKVNSSTLSSSTFTRKIKLKDINPGDIIRLFAGKHIAFVVRVNKNSVTYTHCSNYSRVKGCHLDRIIIKDWSKDLQFQDWKELTRKGNKYRDVTYFPNRGDSIRRPRWWK
jgi:hypothetical protein